MRAQSAAASRRLVDASLLFGFVCKKSKKPTYHVAGEIYAALAEKGALSARAAFFCILLVVGV